MTSGTQGAKHLLREWREHAARIQPGKRLQVDGDIPVWIAGVRTTKAEALLASAMVRWLAQPRSPVPWEAIERALGLRSGEATYLGMCAVRAVCRLRPSCWRRALSLFDCASAAGRRHLLQLDAGPGRRRGLFVRAAVDPDEAVCLEAVHRAALHADRRLFPAVMRAVGARKQTARLRAELKRWAALYRQGYWAGKGGTGHVFRVVVREEGGPEAIVGVLYEDVPSTVVRRLGEPRVVETIRRTYQDSGRPWPIEWDSIGLESAQSAPVGRKR